MATLIKKIKIDFTAKSMKTSSSVIKYVNGKIDFYYDPNHIVGGEYSDDCRFIADITGVQCVIRRFGSDIVVAILPSDHPAIVQLLKNAENTIGGVKKVTSLGLKISSLRRHCILIDEAFEDQYDAEDYLRGKLFEEEADN